jgi:hypothetical protein
MQTVVGNAVESTLLDADQRAAVSPTIIAACRAGSVLSRRFSVEYLLNIQPRTRQINENINDYSNEVSGFGHYLTGTNLDSESSHRVQRLAFERAIRLSCWGCLEGRPADEGQLSNARVRETANTTADPCDHVVARSQQQ